MLLICIQTTWIVVFNVIRQFLKDPFCEQFLTVACIIESAGALLYLMLGPMTWCYFIIL